MGNLVFSLAVLRGDGNFQELGATGCCPGRGLSSSQGKDPGLLLGEVYFKREGWFLPASCSFLSYHATTLPQTHSPAMKPFVTVQCGQGVKRLFQSYLPLFTLLPSESVSWANPFFMVCYTDSAILSWAWRMDQYPVSYLYGLHFWVQQVNKLGFHFYACAALVGALHFTAKELCREPH